MRFHRASNPSRRGERFLSRAFQLRLLGMCTLTIVIGYLVWSLCQPDPWLARLATRSWFSSSETTAPARDSRLANSGSLPEGVFRATATGDDSAPPAGGPRPTDDQGHLADVAIDQSSLEGCPPGLYGTVRDDTVFRDAEREAWFRTWQAIGQTSVSAEAHRILGRVGYLQLFDQANTYRGKLVVLRGTLRRATYVQAPKNDYGIEGYHQCWIDPESGTNPVVVYTLGLPKHWKPGEEMHEDAEVVGVFFKRWAYQSQSGIRVAPLLLGWLLRPAELEAKLQQQGRSRLGMAGRLASNGGAESPAPRISPNGTTEVSPKGTTEATEWESYESIEDPRVYLQLLGISSDAWNAREPNGNLAVFGPLFQARLLHALPRVPLDRVAAWETADNPWDSSVASANAARGRFFRLSGWLERLRVVRLEPEFAQRVGQSQIYACQLRLADDQPRVVVLTREVPQAWQRRLRPPPEPDNAITPPADVPEVDTWDEPTAFSGVYLGGSVDPGFESWWRTMPFGELSNSAKIESRHLFATSRLAWFPRAADVGLDVDTDSIWLASQGFDVSLLDSVTDSSDLGYGDREAFYQLLRTLARLEGPSLVGGEDIRTTPPAETSMSQLLTNESAWRGRKVFLTGTARRAVKVWADPEIAKRIGLRSYYELVVLVQPDARIRVTPKEGAAREFTTYPVVFCATRLPRGFPEGDTIRAEVALSGIFLKNWTYRSEFLSSATPRGEPVHLQMSPLLLGIVPAWTPSKPIPVPDLGRLFLVLFVIGLAIVATVFVVFLRDDRRTGRRDTGRLREHPDFSDLEAQDGAAGASEPESTG